MTARRRDSGSPVAVSEEAIDAWINSCPIPPTIKLRSCLQCIIARVKTDEPGQGPRQLSHAWNGQVGPKQCENMIDGYSKDVIAASPSIMDIDFNHSTRDDVHDQFAASWRREVHDLLRICQDLVAISCRISDTVLNSVPKNAPQPQRSTVVTGESPVYRDARLSQKELDLLAEASPARWEEGMEECTLPDELGTASFDSLLQMLDSDISSY